MKLSKENIDNYENVSLISPHIICNYEYKSIRPFNQSKQSQKDE